MSILDRLGNYIPGSPTYMQHELNIDPFTALALAQQGAKAVGGIASGIIGGGARRREQQEATTEQAQAEHGYLNFDFAQDVGPIVDPYASQAQQAQEFGQQQIDRTTARAVNVAQESGAPGAIQSIIGQGNLAAEQVANRTVQLRSLGSQYVENIRQQRLAQAFQVAGTRLGRADHRLAAANQARQAATNNLIGGIAGGVAIAGANELGAFDGEATPLTEADKFAIKNNIGFGPGQFDLTQGF